jgi:hypothetical protein
MGERPFPASRHNSLHRPQLGQSKVLAQAWARKKLGRIARSRPKRGIARLAARPNSINPEKAKGAPKDAPQKLERLVRAKYLPLALEDLVMKAHVPVPFDR